MGASICWEPVPTKRKTFECSAPQNFLESLRILGWRPERPLDGTFVTALRGMAFAAGQNGQPYVALIEAIEKHGEVRVWAEY